ncbi:MAG: hypothetical protein EA382_07495 [Spirochaetaceae bacterium]|nr:MAG: hypothetical protein EA382_07495 [Spirochaetaceae bacterium]
MERKRLSGSADRGIDTDRGANDRDSRRLRLADPCACLRAGLGRQRRVSAHHRARRVRFRPRAYRTVCPAARRSHRDPCKATRLMRWLRVGLVLAGLSWLASTGGALIVRSDHDEVRVAPDSLEFVRDPDGGLDIATVVKLHEEEWQPAPAPLAFGYTRDAIWLRMRVRNESTNPIVTLGEFHGIDRFDVFIGSADGTDLGGAVGRGVLRVGSSGWMVRPDESWFTRSVSFSAVPLNLARDRETIVYIRMESTSSLNPRFSLLGGARLLERSRSVGLLQGIGVGFAVMVVVYAFVALSSGKRPEFIIYFALAIVLSILITYGTGLGPLVLWRAAPGVTSVVGRIGSLLTFGLSLQLFRFLMELDRRHRIILAATNTMTCAIGGAVAAVLVFPVVTGFQIASIGLIVIYPVTLVLLVACAVLRFPASMPVLIAWGTLLLAGGVQTLVNLGRIAAPDGFADTSLVLTIAFIVQSSMIAATILRRTEAARMGDRDRRRVAELEIEAVRGQIVDAARAADLANLVADIAHELETPLGTALLIGSDLRARTRMADDAAVRKADSDAIADAGTLLEESAIHARTLVHAVRQTAKEQATLAAEILDVDAYIARVLRPLVLRYKRSEHELTWEVPAGLGFRTVPGFLTQIITNLVRNAVEHGLRDRSGRVCVTAGIEAPGGVTAGSSNRSLCIVVSDDGAGIPPDVLPRVFDRFYTSAEERGGSGLGLSIVKTLVEEKLSGTVVVRSDINGGGTRFTIRIPECVDGADAPSVSR